MRCRPAASLLVRKVDKLMQCLLNVWHCMDHCVTDDATIHILVHVCEQIWTLEQYYDILVHVCGQIWTLEQYYDSINIILVKCFIFVTHNMTKLYLL